MEEKTWDAISIAEVVRRAQSSVGAFYARFPDKDALLDYLDDQYAQDVVDSGARFVEDEVSAGSDLATLIRHLIGPFVVYHRKHRGLLRALVLRARTYRETSFDERTLRMNAVIPAMLEVLETRLDEVRHPDAKRAIFLAFTFAFSAMRDYILFPESIIDPEPCSDEELTDELCRLVLAYLGVKSG